MTEPDKTETMERVRQARRVRVRRFALRFGVLVLLPTLLAALYYGVIASPRYTSQLSFTVRGGSGGDGLLMRSYLESRAAFARLDEEQGFREHCRERGADWLTRLSPGAGFEDAYADFRRRVQVTYDASSGLISVQVVLYSPAVAQQVAKALLRYAEEMSRRLSGTSGEPPPGVGAGEPSAAADAGVPTGQAEPRPASAKQGRGPRIVVISAPSRSDAPTHPRRWAGVGTVFALSVLATTIGALLLAAVREHVKV